MSRLPFSYLHMQKKQFLYSDVQITILFSVFMLCYLDSWSHRKLSCEGLKSCSLFSVLALAWCLLCYVPPSDIFLINWWAVHHLWHGALALPFFKSVWTTNWQRVLPHRKLRGAEAQHLVSSGLVLWCELCHHHSKLLTVSMATLSPGLHEEDERGRSPWRHEGQGQNHLWQHPPDLRLAQRVRVLSSTWHYWMWSRTGENEWMWIKIRNCYIY